MAYVWLVHLMVWKQSNAVEASTGSVPDHREGSGDLRTPVADSWPCLCSRCSRSQAVREIHIWVLRISEHSSTATSQDGYPPDGVILQPIEEDGTLGEGYGSISVAASVATSTAQTASKKLPPWLNSHNVRQSVPISTPTSATRNEVWLPQGGLVARGRLLGIIP